MRGTRSFLNSIKKRWPFLPIVPRVHTIFDPRTFLIFLFTFIECKHNFKHFLQLYLKIRQANHPKCFLCTQPRSGSRYTTNLYRSALALARGKSGKPCFNPKDHSWDYETDLYRPSTLRELVYEFNPKKLHPRAISWAHYPLQKPDLINMKSVRPVILVRNPLDGCKAWYQHRDARTPKEWYASKKIGLEKQDIISHRIERIIYYLNYWGEYMKNKKSGKDYLCIKYEELVENPVDALKSLFQFWGMKIDEDILIKAAELNTYKNTMKYVLEKDVSETGVITIRKKTDFDDDILALIKEKLNKELIHDFGYKY